MFNDPVYLSNLSKSGQIIALGMFTVFTALTFFAIVIWLITTIDEKINEYKIKRYAQKVEAQEIHPDENDELIAVLAAAAFVMIQKPVKISKIRFLDESKSSNVVWSASGRSTLMSSHTTKG